MPARYRAEHVGSLLRPPELLQARGAFAQGRLSPDELRSIEDRAILYSSTEFKKIRLLYFTEDFKNWESEHAP